MISLLLGAGATVALLMMAGLMMVASALNDVAREFGTALGIALLAVMATGGSFVDGWQTAMWTGVAIMAVLFAVVLRRR